MLRHFMNCVRDAAYNMIEIHFNDKFNAHIPCKIQRYRIKYLFSAVFAALCKLYRVYSVGDKEPPPDDSKNPLPSTLK